MIIKKIDEDNDAIIGIEAKDVLDCEKYLQIYKNDVIRGEYSADLIRQMEVMMLKLLL